MRLRDLSPRFDHLSLLSVLDLSENELSGQIPDFDQFEMTQIHLKKNKLSGQIPDFDLPNLSHLYLNDNRLLWENP